MKKKTGSHNFWVLFIPVVFAGVIAAVFMFNKSGNVGNFLTQELPVSEEDKIADKYSGYDFQPLVSEGTRRKFTYDLKTVEYAAGQSYLDEEVAIPKYVTQIGNVTFRGFDLRLRGNEYVPRVFVVNEGDVIDLDFTAETEDHEIYFPDFEIQGVMPKGETKRIQFQTKPYGEYSFFCRQPCENKASGVLVVNIKK